MNGFSQKTVRVAVNLGRWAAAAAECDDPCHGRVSRANRITSCWSVTKMDRDGLDAPRIWSRLLTLLAVAVHSCSQCSRVYVVPGCIFGRLDWVYNVISGPFMAVTTSDLRQQDLIVSWKRDVCMKHDVTVDRCSSGMESSSLLV